MPMHDSTLPAVRPASSTERIFPFERGGHSRLESVQVESCQYPYPSPADPLSYEGMTAVFVSARDHSSQQLP